MYNHVPALEGCHLFPFLLHLRHHVHQHPHCLGKKKERECDDKVKELHCKHSQLKKVPNNLFYFTDLAHFSIHLELKLNITFLPEYKIQMYDRAVL